MEVKHLNLFPNESNLKKACIICEKEKDKGFHLYTSFICSECHKILINTDVTDKQYSFYVEQLKKGALSQTLK